MDRAVNLPRVFGYVEFRKKVDAEKAILYMDGAQIDGNIVRVRFTLPPRQKPSSPPKPVAPKHDAPQKDKFAWDTEKDVQPKVRESSPRCKPLSPPPRRRSPPHRRGESPRCRPESPPSRRVESPMRHRAESPYWHGETPPRRRPASPPRRLSPSPAPRRQVPYTDFSKERMWQPSSQVVFNKIGFMTTSTITKQRKRQELALMAELDQRLR